MSRTVAISTGPETHLDHLAPLCYREKIPLVVTEKEHLSLAEAFYPMIETRYLPLEALTLHHIANSYDTILTCGKFWALELKPLLKLFFNKEIRFVFTPHGHSDKEELLDHPIAQDLELVYAPNPAKPDAIVMGNVRRAFYLEHKDHFDELAAPHFLSKKPTVLYAPTWSTKASQSSFFTHFESVFEQLHSSYHLLVKLHPLLEENDPALYHKLLQYPAHFLQKFPPIYPLLERTDFYLGDTSSIGYDFLAYDRPLFFLEGKGPLTACGEPFTGSIHPQLHLSAARKSLYQNTFANPIRNSQRNHNCGKEKGDEPEFILE